MLVIDAHVHLFPDEVVCARESCLEGEPCFAELFGDPAARMASAEQLVAGLDADGVAAAVTCAFPWRDLGRARAHNDCILAAAAAHPGRLVPLAAVDPLAPGAAAEAERALAAAAAGLGEIGVYHDDLAAAEVAAAVGRLAGLCAEADRPLLLHTNEPVGHAYPGKSPMSLRGLYGLIQAHPRTRFQLAHLGGGLFLFELLKREVRGVLAHCVFDTAAAPYLYRPALYPLFCELAGARRLLYGSDYPLLALDRYRREFDRAGLAPEQLQRILGANARDFWRLG